MTQMRELEGFLPHALPYAPTVPEPTIFKHLRDICREVCEATKSWRETDSFTIAAPDYEGLVTIADADIIHVEESQLEGNRLTPKTVKELDEIRPGWTFDTEEGSAAYITQMQPNSLTIYPRQTGLLQLRLVLRPSLDAILVPEWLISQHGNQIGKGAAGRALLVPKTEFYNPELAAPLISEFDDWLGGLAPKARRGQQGGKLRTRGSMF